MKLYPFRSNLLIAIAITALLSIGVMSCSDDTPTNTDNSSGEIKMYMVDAPGDYDEVNIVVTEVSVHMSAGDTTIGWMVIDSSTRTINLLNLTNGNVDIIGSGRLHIGSYSQIRLKIGTGSNVVVGGTTHPLEIPSGSQTGLKINHAFDIETNVLYELTLDFDASKSIHQTGNGRYMMRPVIRATANRSCGSISGMVNPASSFSCVRTMVGSDSLATYAHLMNGGFMLMALPSGIYTVTIESGVALYADSTITGVSVTARNNTNLGTINLRQR